MSGAIFEGLAAGLAAVSAAALVCGVFYPALSGDDFFARRGALFAALRKPGQDDGASTNRNIRRAQEFALKAIAETNRARRATRLDARLTAAGLRWRRGRFLAACAALGAVLLLAGVLARVPLTAAVTGAVLGAWLLPLRALGWLAGRRRRQFLAGFAAAVDMIVRGAKAGLSVGDCLAVVTADATPPIAKEFSVVLAQLRAGVPLSDAMAKLGAAMPAPEVRFFALIMSFQSQTGGNLSEALGNLSRVLRDRQRLAAKVRTASAEVRASAITVGALPFVVGGGSAVFSPEYLSPLWTDDTGRQIVMLSAVWMLIGVMSLRRMARIEP